MALRASTGFGRNMRGALDASGSTAVSWPIERFLEAGDRATGTAILDQLYRRMKDRPDPIDLEALWRLGVTRHERAVRFGDTAPLSWVCQSITPHRALGSHAE